MLFDIYLSNPIQFTTVINKADYDWYDTKITNIFLTFSLSLVLSLSLSISIWWDGLFCPLMFL